MNEQQYYKWKADTYNALISSGIYNAQQAKIIVDWFDIHPADRERQLVGDGIVDALKINWRGDEFTDENLVYKVLTARAWLYADKILSDHEEPN